MNRLKVAITIWNLLLLLLSGCSSPVAPSAMLQDDSAAILASHPTTVPALRRKAHLMTLERGGRGGAKGTYPCQPCHSSSHSREEGR